MTSPRHHERTSPASISSPHRPAPLPSRSATHHLAPLPPPPGTITHWKLLRSHHSAVSSLHLHLTFSCAGRHAAPPRRDAAGAGLPAAHRRRLSQAGDVFDPSEAAGRLMFQPLTTALLISPVTTQFERKAIAAELGPNVFHFTAFLGLKIHGFICVYILHLLDFSSLTQ